jgi:hypothetical protein
VEVGSPLVVFWGGKREVAVPAVSRRYGPGVMTSCISLFPSLELSEEQGGTIYEKMAEGEAALHKQD